MHNKITVFTPTFNREYIIKNLYESLTKQTFEDFEWLVVDDGSKDNTEELIESFIKEDLIKIRYIKQKNGGKHRSINKGIELANGELFFIVDSDDKLTDEALEIINSSWDLIPDKEGFCGISGLRGYSSTDIIGNSHSIDILDCSILDYRYRYNIKGDKAEVFLTKILKENKFPEFEGENFIAEGIVWNKLGSQYKMRWINEIIYICNYLEDGLTNKITSLRIKNIQGTLLLYKTKTTYNIPYKYKLLSYINYYRFLYHSKLKKRDNIIENIEIGNVSGIILGFLVYLYDALTLEKR